MIFAAQSVGVKKFSKQEVDSVPLLFGRYCKSSFTDAILDREADLSVGLCHLVVASAFAGLGVAFQHPQRINVELFINFEQEFGGKDSLATFVVLERTSTNTQAAAHILLGEL